jgi:protoporphyrinogen oxidase
MSEAIKDNGGHVFLSAPVSKVIVENYKAKGIQMEDGTIKEYDNIISSMPMSLLVSRLNDVPASILEYNSKLKYRNTIIVYLLIDAINLFPDNWLYINSVDLLSGRITNFRNWVPTLYNESEKTVLAMEYWCYEEDDLWKSDDNKLIELAKNEIRKSKLIKNANILEGFVYKISKCYPVYSRGYKSHLKPIENYLSKIDNLQLIGRYGSFKYNNQDHSILMGMLAAENIINNNVKHYLWDINTDYDNYQEKSF